MEAIPLAAGVGSIASNLFGGGGQKTSSKPVDMTAPWFKQLGQSISGVLGNAALAGPNTSAIYSGPLTGNIRGNEGSALDVLQQSALNPLRTGYLNSVLSGAYLPGGANANPFLNATIEAAQRPTMQALQDAVGRQIPGMFAAAGQQGGGTTARTLANARATEAGGKALGDIATNISNNAYNTERGFQNQGVQLGQQDIQAMIANLQAQGLPRTIQDTGITRAIALGQQGVQNWLQGLQIAGGLPLQTVANQSQGTASPNLSTSLFGNQGVFGGLNSAYGQNSIFGTAPKLFG